MANKTLLPLVKWKPVLWSLFLSIFLISANSYGQAPFPYTFINNSSYSDDQLYIAIVGEDLSGPPGQRVWIDLKTGQQRPMATSYNTVQGPTYGGNMGPGGNGKYASCFTKLSEIPNKTFNLTGIQGSRVFISINQQLYLYFFGPNAGYTAPDPGNPNDPNRGIHYEIIEMTYNNIGIWANTSRVDAYQVPMAVEVTGGSGFQMTGELLSHSEIVAAFQANVPVEFQGCYDPVTGEIKQPSKTAAFQPGGAYANYMKPYIDAIWNKYKNEDLVVDLAGNGVWRGRVQADDRLIMNCQSGGWNGRQGIVQARPSTQEALEGKGVLAQPIGDVAASLFFQAQLCAAITRHVVNTTTGGTQNWYDASKYYLESPCNHYAKFWHLPGISVNRLSYGFAYDDVNEQSSTIFASGVSKTVVVIGGYVPKVALTAPANNSTYSAPASITFQATASAATPSRSITKVEFYNGTTKIGEDNSSPYSFNWTNVAAGTYTITAKAIDNMGVVGTSTPITVKVNAPSIPPTVSITAPINNAIFYTPANVNIQANATAASGSTISKVEFYNGATKLGEDATSPYAFDWTNVPVGTYSITAKAIDNNNLSTTSAVITFEVKAPVAPTSVVITSPTNNATYTAPVSVTIDATATQGSSAISKVEFYNGATKLGEDATSPYSFNWANVAVGTYSITARAIDNNNLSTTSAVITFEVKAPVGPGSVVVTSPANNATFLAPASITIDATATQGSSAITKVEFYNGTTKLGEDLTSPYSFNWTNVAEGTYSITAKAIDANNLSATSAVISIEVKTPVSPTVTITSPLNNSSYFAPASITIEATATQGTGAVTKVEFYNGATKIGEDLTSPYSFNWTNVAAGNYSITAKVIDVFNLTATSVVVSVEVKTPVTPTVSITAPANNAVFYAPATIAISADATQGTYPISKVEFYNGATKIGEDNSSPYTFDWTNVAVGTYTITAKAIDNTNLSTTSAPVVVEVRALAPPFVEITSPANNATFVTPIDITIQASATQGTGALARVEFYNGTTKLGEDAAAPYSFDWTNVDPGIYSITAKVIDVNNLTYTSAVITIEVKANQAPVVSIISPANNSVYKSPASVQIEATASDVDGTIQKVEFFNGTALIGTDNSAPYTASLINLQAGTYSITAKATDNVGLTTVSSAITIQVNDNVLPQVSITAPANNILLTAPASVTIEADASDADGTVTKVEFYHGAIKLGEDLSSPYTYAWTNIAAGTYEITARAIDDNGGIKSSSPVTIVVNRLPQVSITSPVNNASYVAPSNIVITASATDLDGTIAKVEFYNGTQLLFTANAAPYTYTLLNAVAGTYTFTAIAFDDRGASVTSTAVTVEVKENILPSISIISPISGIELTSPADITVEVEASDADGVITKIEFYNGTIKIGEDVSAPYLFQASNVAAGDYVITARAYDDKGGITSASVNIKVSNSNNAPQLSIISPTKNSNLNSVSAIDIFVVANDNDGSIVKVEFFDGDVKIGEQTQAPYSYTWTNASPGTHIIRVVATDNSGQTTEVATSVNVQAVTSTLGNYVDNKLIVYPNPTFGEVHFTKTIERIEVYDLNGVVVMQENMSGMDLLNISELPSGVYMLRLLNNDSSDIVKITKQ